MWVGALGALILVPDLKPPVSHSPNLPLTTLRALWPVLLARATFGVHIAQNKAQANFKAEVKDQPTITTTGRNPSWRRVACCF